MRQFRAVVTLFPVLFLYIAYVQTETTSVYYEEVTEPDVETQTEKSASSEEASNSGNLTENEVIANWSPTKGITIEDLPEALRDWEPPEYISRNFPYYLSGYDYEDRPIWISEFGKFDLQKMVRMGPVVRKQFEMYVARAARILTDSHKWKNPDGETISVIIDFDGLRLIQYADIPTINFVLKLARDYAKILEKHLDVLVVINVNYVAETFIHTIRPVFNSILQVAEFYGTDKSKWVPRLLRHFPQSALPEWYGGFKNFTPVKVLG